ncbi:hypothetical protein DYGSA30_32660 [Dyella sp. GSA-30]|nr:hypothetical protein DYGSA30_32660 [Dyella sp. GSA-30]
MTFHIIGVHTQQHDMPHIARIGYFSGRKRIPRRAEQQCLAQCIGRDPRFGGPLRDSSRHRPQAEAPEAHAHLPMLVAKIDIELLHRVARFAAGAMAHHGPH